MTPPSCPRPAIGATVHDTAFGRIGVVMGYEGPHVQLRPLGGGREWDAAPDHMEIMTRTATLSARVAEANARSRKR
ncbi:hypothetical protein [Streptomyces sp. NPDC052225]|uniref:hypothetical protein n=1 Tax=Streptomyces sp. NPDC052225 TaxID=3154949 RepID=UPI00342C56AF